MGRSSTQGQSAKEMSACEVIAMMEIRSWRYIAAALVLIATGCTNRWSEADKFVGGLRCGMTMAEVEQYSKQFDGTISYRTSSENLPPLVVKHDGTRVQLFFEEDRLTAAQVTWISEPMKLTTEPRQELCTPAASR